MCPACLALAALVAAGTASAGGLVVKKIRRKPALPSPVKKGAQNGTPKNKV